MSRVKACHIGPGLTVNSARRPSISARALSSAARFWFMASSISLMRARASASVLADAAALALAEAISS